MRNEYGITPTIWTYTALLFGLVSRKAGDDALAIYNRAGTLGWVWG